VKFGPLRRLYHWVLGWATHPSATWALFLIAFAESSFFPIPPDVLLIALGLGRPTEAFRFATVCTAGSVIGGMAGYAIGILVEPLAHTMLGWFADAATIEKVRQQFDENTFLYVAIAGFTPIPYKVFTILAGVAHVSFPVFVLASIASRGARFFLEAVLLRIYGEKAKGLLESKFEWITIIGGVVLVAGFLCIKYVF
jgi:membrane protein YqaA with SNARE-associated domain